MMRIAARMFNRTKFNGLTIWLGLELKQMTHFSHDGTIENAIRAMKYDALCSHRSISFIV